MLTEEQIQRLAKIVVDELGYDEKEAEKEAEKGLRIAVNLANSVHDFLALFGYGKSMENTGRFFDEEAFIRSLRILKKTNEIKKMVKEALENKEQIQA